MKCGLLALALLGSPATGCWARSSVDGKQTPLARLKLAEQATTSEATVAIGEPARLPADRGAMSVRELRVQGKRALTEACDHDRYFLECSQDQGSAVRLEECLREKSDSKLSLSCRLGLLTWKRLLAETAHAPPNRKGFRSGKGKKRLAGARGAQADVTARLEEGTEVRVGDIDDTVIWMDESAAMKIDSFDSPPHHPNHLYLRGPHGGPPHHGKGPHPHGPPLHGKVPHPPGPPPRGNGPHPHGPPPHGKEPHHGPHHHGPPHHGKGPHLLSPPEFLEDDVFQRPERRPTMFSVLTEWIFGDSSSSSSDSVDSSSDSWDSLEAWESSSSDDGDELLTTSFRSTSGVLVDADFFPAEHRDGVLGTRDEDLAIVEALPVSIPRVHQDMESALAEQMRPKEIPFGRRSATKGQNLRGKSFGDGVYRHPPQGVAGVPDGVLTPNAAYALDAPDDVRTDKIGRVFTRNEKGNDIIKQARANPLKLTKARRDNGKDRDFRGFRDSWPSAGATVSDEEELEMLLAAGADEEGIPMFIGGPHVHSKQHHHGDHIRFRNRLPEDFENNRAWLTDSFDMDGDGPDLVEGVLAFFFFVGACTLLLLPFFLLGRALKRLVHSSRGDDEDAAPDGYYALPEDAATADASAVAAGMVSADDDDSIVVTGTPVNPPPSVHL